MPNLYFGVLKRVKNGLKMAKKHIEILYFSLKCQTGGGGGSEGSLAKDQTFSGFFFRTLPLYDDILENNDTIFGKTITIFRNRK